MCSEKWLPVPGFEGVYEVSDHGKVRSLPRSVEARDGRVFRYKGRTLADWLNNYGYPTVNLSRDGICSSHAVHRVVLRAFVGECPRGQEVRHLNDVKQDNRLTNLRYGTRSENMLDGVRNGKNRWSRSHV